MQLIDDLPHNYGGDYALDNWKRSLEVNNVIELQRKQRVQPEKKLNLWIG